MQLVNLLLPLIFEVSISFKLQEKNTMQEKQYFKFVEFNFVNYKFVTVYIKLVSKYISYSTSCDSNIASVENFDSHL